MAIRNKNNPFSNAVMGGIAKDELNKKTPAGSVRHNMTTSVGGAHQAVCVPSRGVSITGHVTQSTYNDPTLVRQWVASSANGSNSLSDELYNVESGPSCNTEVHPFGPIGTPSVSADVGISLSHVYRHDGIPYPNNSDEGLLPSDHRGVGYPGFYPVPSLDTCNHYLPGQESQNGICQIGPQPTQIDWNSSYDHQAVPALANPNVMYSYPLDMHPNATMIHDESLTFPPAWISARSEQINPWTGSSLSHQLPLAAMCAPTMEASSSSYSQGSFFANSPRSSLSIEDSASIDPGRSADDDQHIQFKEHEYNEVQHFYPGAEHMDNTSTLRPSRDVQRPPLSNIVPWSQCEPGAGFYIDPSPLEVACQRRPSGETELASARDNELYHIGPKDDGLYHCPFAKEKGCTHKAEKLKCNYDKHLDSHLKPYRCKVHACSAVPFSSTACLLRHEREAHGMHGHGEKPHLCSYEDCERSIPGYGFPRRWNLYDHMKRVHDYAGPASSNGSASPTPSSTSSHHQGTKTTTVRKRRSSGNSQAQAAKRPKSTTGPKVKTKPNKAPALMTLSGKQQQSMQQQWQEQRAALQERLSYLDPNDSLGMEQISADQAILHTIGMNIRRHQAGQFASE